MPAPPTQSDSNASGRGRAPERFGPYRLLEELGRGGMGVVYLAEHVEHVRRVALKVLSTRFGASDKAFVRFEREVRTVARLQHPRLVQVFELGRVEGNPYFTMEVVDGVPLSERLASLRGADLGFAELRSDHLRDGLPEAGADQAPESDSGSDSGNKGYLEAACRLVLDVAEGLQHAHDQGVVHRDVKPSNIMVRSDGRGQLFDFGLAKVDSEASLTLSGEFIGTPHYVSPEQARPGAAGAADGRSDVFALGVTLYEVLTLDLPFRGDTPHEVFRQVTHAEPRSPRRINPAVPRDLATICLCAMEKDPARRYQSPAEMADDLRRFLQWKPVEARPVGPATRALRFVRRNAAASTVSVLCALLLVALAVVAWQYQVGRAVEEEQRRAELASARSHFKSASMHAQRGAWDEAIGEYERAEELGFDDPVALALGRIEVFEGEGDLAAAEVEFEKLRGREHGEHHARALLLEADLGVSRRLQPNAHLDKVRAALEIGGLDPADKSYARALLADDLEQVREHLERTLSLQPFHRRAHESIAPVLLSLGHLGAALDAARRMSYLYPGDPYPVLLQVVVLSLQGHFGQASEQLEQARDLLSPDCADLDRWAASIADSTQIEEELLSQLVGERRGGRRLSPGQLAWKLLRSPAQVLPGVLRSADDPDTFLVEFRMPPALARSYLPLSHTLRLLEEGVSGPMTAMHLVEIDRVLTASLAQQPDGFRSFLRGLYRYFGLLLDGRRTPEKIAACERDFLTAALTPSMIDIGKAAVFYAVEVQRSTWKQRRDDATRKRALANLRLLLDRGDLTPMQFRFLVLTAVEFEELDIADEAALRWRRVHGVGPASSAAQVRLAVLRGRKDRALELAEEALKQWPTNASIRVWRDRARKITVIGGDRKAPSSRVDR